MLALLFWLIFGLFFNPLGAITDAKEEKGD